MEYVFGLKIISLAVIIMAAYLATTVKLFGLPPSLSDTFYLLDRRKQGSGYFFTALCFLEAILVVICMLDLSEGEWFQFTSFLACSGLAFVGAAPLFKNAGMENKIHVTGALLCAVFSQLWVILMGYWYVPAVLLAISMIIILKNGNRVFWLEMVAFLSTYSAIFLEII